MTHSEELVIVDGPAQGRAVVLRLRGRLDGFTAPSLIKRCALIQAQGQNLVLNLAGVSFLGSTGIGALFSLTEQFQEQAGALILAELSEQTRAVVDLLGLDKHLVIHASEAGALAAIQA